MLESCHVCCCVPRVVISRLRLIHAHDAIVLALEVDWDKFAATFRWWALSPLSRALPSSKLQLSLHLLLGNFSLITVLILQLCQSEHSFAIWDAFSHLRTLLLHTYAVIASWKTYIVGIDWHSHVHLGLVVVIIDRFDGIFGALRLTYLNADFMHVIHLGRLSLVHEGLLIIIFAISREDLLRNYFSSLVMRDDRINFRIKRSHWYILLPPWRWLSRYLNLFIFAFQAWRWNLILFLMYNWFSCDYVLEWREIGFHSLDLTWWLLLLSSLL